MIIIEKTYDDLFNKMNNKNINLNVEKENAQNENIKTTEDDYIENTNIIKNNNELIEENKHLENSNLNNTNKDTNNNLAETNCLALTVKKDYNLVVIKNIFTTTGRLSWKIGISTFFMNLLRMFF